MKKWYQSKTVWAAAGSFLAVVLTAVLADPESSAWLNQYAAWSLPVIMFILRLVTKTGVAK